MKKCNVCGIYKPHSHYHKDSAYASGYSNRCRDCNTANTKAWREKVKYKQMKNHQRRHNTRLTARWARKKGCSLCHTRGPSEMFMIIDPQGKRKKISYDWGRERLKSELSDTRVVCLNCNVRINV